jgi:hypothetical protein
MKERKAAGVLPDAIEVPEVVDRSGSAATFRFTMRSVQHLFDDLYDAEVVEQTRRKKQQNKEPKRVIEVENRDRKTGKVNREKRYV